MGKKVNPLAMRPDFANITRCKWFVSNKRHFAKNIIEDCHIREIAKDVMGERLFAEIFIERIGGQTNITIHTHKPGVIVSARDNKIALIEEYKKKLITKIFYERPFQVFLSEILRPELNAIIVANNIAEQLENRMSTKSCMKKAMMTFSRNCSYMKGGIRIVCSGRVGGAEIARKEKVQEGKMPLASIKSDIQMAIRVAHTVYGTVSVRVYIFLPKDFNDFRERTYTNNQYERKRYPSGNNKYNSGRNDYNDRNTKTGYYKNEKTENSSAAGVNTTENQQSHEGVK